MINNNNSNIYLFNNAHLFVILVLKIFVLKKNPVAQWWELVSDQPCVSTGLCYIITDCDLHSWVAVWGRVETKPALTCHDSHGLTQTDLAASVTVERMILTFERLKEKKSNVLFKHGTRHIVEHMVLIKFNILK